MTVTVPGHRFDISIWEDLSEEVARIFGYNNIPSELPTVKVHRARIAPHLYANKKLKEILIGCGLCETTTFSFTTPQEIAKVWPDGAQPAIPILNPLSDDHTHIRFSLIPGVLKTIAHNRKNSPLTPIEIFELGRVFINPESPAEHDAITIAISGDCLSVPAKSLYKADVPLYYVLKGIVEEFLSAATALPVTFRPATSPVFHPYRCAEVFVDGKPAGTLGEVHPSIAAAFEIRDAVALADFDIETVRANIIRVPHYNRIARLPALVRDLSFVVPDTVPASAINDAIASVASTILEDVSLFDVYSGDQLGTALTSVSYTLSFRHPEKTLSDDDVAPVIQAVIDAVATQTGGKLRD